MLKITIAVPAQLVAGAVSINGKEIDPMRKVVCTRGDTLEVPEKLGNWLLKHKAALPGDVDAAKAVTSDNGPLKGCPGADELIAAGINTPEELQALMVEHKDDWPAQVKGIGKGTAPKVLEWLQNTLKEND